MLIKVKMSDLHKENYLLKTILKDDRVLANSLVYLLSEYFPELRVVYSDSVMLLSDEDGVLYKVFSSKSGKFSLKQSCTKGVGRDDSFGNWREFTCKHNITKTILVNTKNKEELVIKVLDHVDGGEYEV